MNLFKDLPAGENPPQKINVVIDLPAGAKNKYEYDEEGGFFALDRVLHSAVYYPIEYGFLPQSKGGDGDSLDVMVLCSYPTFPGCLIKCCPVGILYMEDEKGVDNKILAVPEEKVDPYLKEIRDIDDVPEHRKKEIANFFAEYKKLEPGGKHEQVVIKGWGNKEEAEKVIKRAIQKFQEE